MIAEYGWLNSLYLLGGMGAVCLVVIVAVVAFPDAVQVFLLGLMALFLVVFPVAALAAWLWSVFA
jgi:hypothetical protein